MNASGDEECRAAGLARTGCGSRACRPVGLAAGFHGPGASEAAGWPPSVTSFAELGPWLAWGILNDHFSVQGVSLKFLFRDGRSPQEGRSKHLPLLPLRVSETSTVWSLKSRPFEGLSFCNELSLDAWFFCIACGINWLAGFHELIVSPCPSKKAGNRVNSEVECLLRGEVAKLLERGSSGFDRVDLDSIWKELDKAVLSYTGEEILPLRPLTVEQMEPALPPAGAGGRVNALDLVDGGTKRFLSDPRLSMLQSSEIEPGPCRAKVHVSAGAGAAVARLLVERGVCKPMKLSDVGCVANERILNGLFGVPKPKTLEDGRPVLRTIINLIPSNRVQKIIGGHIESLPAIAKWQSIILGEGETLTAFQCDMACAFYLFSLPDVWLPWFCLNFDLSGHELGIESDERFTIACCTLPMGWKSAVGVMQCISRRVLLESRLPESHEIRKDRSVPPWLIKCWREGGQHSWWQVYLDNFISCQVESPSSSQSGKDGAKHFRAALDGWDSFGILCASDKNVEFAGVAHELGAEIDGDLGKLSGGTARLWKTCVASLGQVLLGKVVKEKRLQVLAGRWAFLLQFRRPCLRYFQRSGKQHLLTARWLSSDVLA